MRTGALAELLNLGILRPHKVETAFCSHCGMSKPIHSSFKSTVIFRTKTYDYKILLAATCTESFMLFIPCMLPYFEKFPGILDHGPSIIGKFERNTHWNPNVGNEVDDLGKFLF